jgi:HTH-type transcriptional regulator/antitoxin HigA
MEHLKYKVIKSASQYHDYLRLLEVLVNSSHKNRAIREEIELLTVLIERWQQQNNSFNEIDPISLLKSLMEGRNLRPSDLATVLKVSKGLISDILNYRKGLSKRMVRELSTYFKVSQEAFNRDYDLV